MITAISVGSCYDLKMSRKEAVNFIHNYAVNGIELVFATPKEILEFEFDKEILDLINSFEFRSIHMPFHEVEYKADEETRKVITKGSEIANSIKASYLVFHPSNIKNFSVLDYSKKNCIENLNSKKYNKGYQTPSDIKKVLKENPKLWLVLDTCHMLESGFDPNDFLELKDRVVSLHLAVQWKQGERIRTHGFLQENLEQLEKIKPLLKLDVPKIIEVDIYPNKVKMIEKEIELVKSLS